MSLKNKFLSLTALAVATVAFSAIGMAQEVAPTTADKTEKVKGEGRGHGKHKMGGRHGGRGKMGGKGMHFMRGLDLTEAQKTQLKAIREANKPTAEARTERRTLAMAKRDGTITTEQTARLTELKAQAKGKAANVKAQIDAILTVEQKAQIEAKKAEMKLRREERRQKRQNKVTATETAKPTMGN